MCRGDKRKANRVRATKQEQYGEVGELTGWRQKKKGKTLRRGFQSESKRKRDRGENIESLRRNQTAQRALCQCTLGLVCKSGLWPFALIENATLQATELCFVLQAHIKQDILLLFGMRGQKVGTKIPFHRGILAGICNSNQSVFLPCADKCSNDRNIKKAKQACRQANK